MRYDDSRHLKDREIKSRYDEDTDEAVRAGAKLHRLQPAVFVRMCVEEKLAHLISQDDNETTQTA